MEKTKRKVVVGGNYILKNKLGQGSFGQIYSGYAISSNEEVAIKLVIWLQISF